MNNYGTATLAGTYDNSGLYFGNGATLDNEAGASFDIADNSPIWAYGGTPGGGTVNNQGTFVKTAGSGTSVVGQNYSGGAVSFNQSGSGTVQVQSGTLQLDGGGSFSGTVEATGGGSLTMSPPPTNLASGTLTGATWIVGANSSISLGGAITTDAANIVLNGSGAAFSGLSSLTMIASTDSLELGGGLSFTTTGNFENGGTVDLAPGTLNVTGQFTEDSTASLGVGIGGLTAGSQFGQLDITGQASLGGAFSVAVLNGFTPAPNESYAIMNFGSETGSFASETGLNVGDGITLYPTFQSTSLELVAGASTVVSWINPNGGDWDTASNWSTGMVPTAIDDVTISIAVTNPITHNASNTDFVNSLTSQDPITLSGGSLSIAITASLSASLTLEGGTINGGTIDLSGGGTLVGTSSGGTLAGVTLDGTLDMTAYDATVTVTDGLTLDGTIDLGSTIYNYNYNYGYAYGDLNFQGAQTLGGTGSVVFGNSSANAINTASAER